jgi:NitT/TauT family transport system substrate-binding protein
MLKRFYVKPLCMLLATVLLAACTNLQIQAPAAESNPSGLPKQEPIKLNVCDSGRITSVFFEIAQQAGLFHKYGLAVNLLPVSASSDAMIAVITGDADICSVTGSTIVNAALAGEGVVITAGLINQQFFSLVVRPEIETAQDLKGKMLATGSPGGSSELFLRSALALLDLQPDTDVAIISMASSTERLAAMESGQVASAVVTVPDAAGARKLGFHTLLDASDLGTPYQHQAIVTTDAFLNDNRQTVVNFMRSLIETIALMKQDPEQTIAWMSTALSIDPVEDALYLEEIYEIMVHKFLPQVPYPTSDGVQLLIDEGRAKNPNAVELTLDDLIDDSIVRELEESGFIKNLYGEQ